MLERVVLYPPVHGIVEDDCGLSGERNEHSFEDCEKLLGVQDILSKLPLSLDSGPKFV